MKTPFWKSDWFLALAVGLGFILASGGTLQRLEYSAYDLGLELGSGIPSERVAVIAIDERSTARLGGLPWPRDLRARLLERLTEAQARVVVDTTPFSEPQLNPGLRQIEALLTLYRESGLERQAPAFGVRLREAEEALDTDRRLAAAINAAGNVLLAMPLTLGEPRGREEPPLPGHLRSSLITDLVDESGALEGGRLPLPGHALKPPIPELGQAAAGIGHPVVAADGDGTVRSLPLVVQHYQEFIPSLALLAAAHTLGSGQAAIRLRLGEGVELAGQRIDTDPNLRLRPRYYRDVDGWPPFPVDSFDDVLSGRVPLSKYRGKAVLIGVTLPGNGLRTPVSESTPPVLLLAHQLSSLLNRDYLRLPGWAAAAHYGALLLVLLYLALLLPRLKSSPAAILSTALLALLLALQFGLLAGPGIWLQLMTAAVLLPLGHLLLALKRLLPAGGGVARPAADAAGDDRALALALQGQGKLDQAFDRFRKCPVDEGLLGLLYKLALEYERQRKFERAGAVYRYMAGYNPKFRDIAARLKRNEQLEGTVMVGVAGGGNGGGSAGGAAPPPPPPAADRDQPRLGRYEIERELGKGAMGVVYLGRDPKINRTVAIKTMALAQEFEEDELADVKARFFREAETAGRLNHPMIVSIFDAGEEGTLAYIAMEFLKGQDLMPYTKPDNLLPVLKVFELNLKVAAALDYAHKQNVVHRDIKPANIMYDPPSGQLKVTDFGIARITDASKTKTGMVLGTPSYMSPEQLAGKKVDGRSDLFSLGVMCFQMFTGQLPFRGESMAALMFKIANDPHPDPLKLRAGLPPCLTGFFDRALAKDPEQRFQTGRDFALALKACAGEHAAQLKKAKGT